MQSHDLNIEDKTYDVTRIKATIRNNRDYVYGIW